MASKKKTAQDMQEVQNSKQAAGAESLANSIIAENKTTADIRNNIDTFKSLVYALMLFTTTDSSDAPQEIQQLVEDSKTADFFRWINKAAETTGADPADIFNKPTPEQQKLLEDIAREEITARYEAAHNSNYTQAINDLLTVKIAADKNNTGAAVRQFAALYFFALHSPELLPIRPRELTAEHLRELRDILNRLDQFIAGRADTDLDTSFNAFIEEAGADPEKIQKSIIAALRSIPDSVDYALDKPNQNLWNEFKVSSEDPSGQLEIHFDTSGGKKKKSKAPAPTVQYSLYFADRDELDYLKISKKLTVFDYRLYMFIDAIYKTGQHTMTISQIYKAQGGKGRPSAADIKKYNDSLTKMRSAIITLDNSEEIAAKMNYPHVKYDGMLLPFERLTADIQGKHCETAIHVLQELPLQKFARDRGQVQRLPTEVLNVPLSNTDANLLLIDYLVDRIAIMKGKNNKAKDKILLATVYKNCAINTRVQKARAKTKIQVCFDHWTKIKWIKSYTITDNEILVIL